MTPPFMRPSNSARSKSRPASRSVTRVALRSFAAAAIHFIRVANEDREREACSWVTSDRLDEVGPLEAEDLALRRCDRIERMPVIVHQREVPDEVTLNRQTHDRFHRPADRVFDDAGDHEMNSVAHLSTDVEDLVSVEDTLHRTLEKTFEISER